MHKLKDKLSFHATKSDSDIPAQISADRPSASIVQPSPAVPKPDSFRKRIGHRLRNVFQSEATSSDTGSGVISSSTWPSSSVQPSSEVILATASPEVDTPAVVPVFSVEDPTSHPTEASTAIVSRPSETKNSSPTSKSTTAIAIAKTVAEGAKVVLEVVTETSDAFGPLKSVLGGIRAILKVCEQYSGNKEKLKKIIARLESLQPQSVARDEKDVDDTRREVLQSKLDPIYEQLLSMQDQGRFTRLAKSTHDENLLSGYIGDINEALVDYQVSMQVRLIEITRDTMNTADILLLHQLPRARDAGHMSEHHQRCLRDTRTEILEAINAWSENPDDRRVYWLNGGAGTGKSTISQSVARQAFAEGRLGASFFCSRGSTERSNIHLIFPTIAFELAFQYPEFREELLKVIKRDPDVGHASMATQLVKMIIEPLKVTGICTIIAIDALDECADPEPASTILSLLARHIHSVPLVKFFITGRPEPRVESGFELELLQPYTEVFILHEVKRQSVDQDIKLYLKSRLSDVAKIRARKGFKFPEPWPVEGDIDILVRKAGGLFIFASTTYKFIASPYGDPHELLQDIVGLPDSTIHEGSLALDALYTRILEDHYASIPKTLVIAQRLQVTLGAVVLVLNPLSLATLAVLLDMKPANIKLLLLPLRSLLLVPEEDNRPIRVFHKSLPDYITDSGRCTNPEFCIQSPTHHFQLAIHCLQLMNSKLRRNICDLPPYAMNRDIVDLSAQRKEHIGEALEYACHFWAQHLCSSSIMDGEVALVVGLLQTLMEEHLLSWLEVLSLCDGLLTATSALRGVQRWLINLKLPNDNLTNSIQDAERFVLRFLDPIQESAMHMYCSVVPWSPESSLVRKRFWGECGGRVKLQNAIDPSWDNCLLKMDVGCEAWWITFSHNGRFLGVSGTSNDGKMGLLKLYDVATGSLYIDLHPQQITVARLAFSLNDTIIATGSKSGEVSVWDVKTGGMIKELCGKGSRIRTVSFSHSGILASGSYDGTVRLWDVDSGTCVSQLDGKSGSWIRAVCWSPKGTELAVARSDKDVAESTVEVWETATCKVSPVAFGKCSLGSIAYSSDGSKLASSDKHSITVRDAKTGSIIRTTLTAQDTDSDILFLPSGRHIAYGTSRSMFIWDLENDLDRWICDVEGNKVVALSPDGTCIAAGTNADFLIRIWRIEEAGIEPSRSSDDQTPKISGLYMSWDGQRVVSTVAYGPMKLWDVVKGSCLMTFNDPNVIRLAAISHDYALVASFSSFKGLTIWSCNDGSVLKTKQGSYGIFNGPTSIRFSPNGRQIVTVIRHRNMVLWDVETAEKIDEVNLGITRRSFTINGDGDFVVSPDPTNLATASIHPEATSEGESSLHSSGRPVIDRAPLPPGYIPVINDPYPIVSAPPLSLATGGWIEERGGRRVFWVPEDLRAGFKATSTMVSLGVRSDRLMWMDFSEVLQ